MKKEYFLLIVLSVFIFTGCGSKKIQQEGIVTNIEVEKKFNKKIKLIVDGGREADVLGLPKVSNNILYEAVKGTIENSNLFSEVVENNEDYKLELFIVYIGQPVVGKVFKVNVEIAWVLKKDNNIIWKKSILTSSEKSIDEIYNGFDRMVITTQEATKNNIEKALKEISFLKNIE